MLLHSLNGMLTDMVLVLPTEKEKKKKLRIKSQRELKLELMTERRIELLIRDLKINSELKDYWLVLVQDLDNQVELTATFWKEKNWNSMPRECKLERNDAMFKAYNLSIINLLLNIFHHLNIY